MNSDERFQPQHEVIDRCPLTGERCGCYEGKEACLFTQDYSLKAYREMFDKIFGPAR